VVCAVCACQASIVLLVLLCIGSTDLQLLVDRPHAVWPLSPSPLHTAGTLVNACGAWSQQIASLAGIPSFPVVPRRRVVFVVHSPTPLPAGVPLVVDPTGVVLTMSVVTGGAVVL
jgi:glycine/D-amino acid oxidase-like deaminating enzyme